MNYIEKLERSVVRLTLEKIELRDEINKLKAENAGLKNSHDILSQKLRGETKNEHQ